VFSINLLKPDWETAINSCDTFKRINIPSINKRPIMEPEPNQALYNIIPKRAKIRVKYTTGVSNISSLPKVTHFPLDEVNISAMSGEDERQRSSVRGHLRPENQIKDLSCRHMEISTQEFWQISKNHVTRLMNLGRRPQELAETSARLIIDPPNTPHTPSSSPDRWEERGVESAQPEREILEVTIWSSRQTVPLESKISALERLSPPLTRPGTPHPRSNNDNSRKSSSRKKKKTPSTRSTSTPGRASSRASRSSHRNPSPPPTSSSSHTTSSMPPQTSSSTTTPRGSWRLTRLVERTQRSASLQIDELTSHIESIFHSAETGSLDKLAIHQAVMLETRRLNQEAESDEGEDKPEESQRKAMILGTFILHLLNKAKRAQRRDRQSNHSS